MPLPKTITVNNREYQTAELSEEARQQLGNIQIAELEMIRLRQSLALAKTAHNAYKGALQQILAKEQISTLEGTNN